MCREYQEVRMKSLRKQDLSGTLKTWAKQYKVLCPSRGEQGDCVFDAFREETFTLDYKKPHLPPKSSFLPQSEVIFTVENGRYGEAAFDEASLLFGIRACDMAGMRQAKSFMLRDWKDIYYSRKAEKTITVVMACAGPQNETCFCTTTSSGPYAETGFDLQCYDMGEVLLFEAGSEQGRGLLTSGPFTDVDDRKGKEQVDTFRQRAFQSIPKVAHVAEAMAMLRNGHVNDEVWEALATKCIVCGGCAFVCPTCTCFNVHDSEFSAGNGLRIRAWDACLYAGFTREASGHNPRSTQALRLKRRHEHKLLYFNEKDVNGNLCGCVGCGRCSDSCPVQIGTLEVVRAIADNRA
jgi:sulfhydrogenase subunit beta (sulfur reductase)